MIRLFVLAGICASTFLLTQGATLKITPNVVSSDYNGVISFQIEGLSPGETVQLVQLYDFNGNGVIDGPDLPLGGDLLTDGQAPKIGGATNLNVLGDDEATPNASITATRRFQILPELARAVGTYIFQLRSSSNRFATVTASLTIQNTAYGQSVKGNVTSGGTNIPYAGVALVQVVGGRIKTVVGTAADAQGHYQLSAPADNYSLIAFWPGYIGDFNSAPHPTLAPGTIVTADIALLPTTTLLSGTLVDKADAALPALPYAQVSAFTTDRLYAIGITDENANFSLPVTPGLWTIRPRWQSAASRFYLVPEPGSFFERAFDTTSGALAGAAVQLKRATALIYGTVHDDHSNSISGITLATSMDGGAFDSFALSDANGAYSLATDAGAGFINVQDLTSLPASPYLWSGDYVNVSDGTAVRQDIVGVVPTAAFRGQLLDDSGVSVGGFPFFANNNNGGTSLGTTDTNGFFNLPVFGGRWELYPDTGASQDRNLIFGPVNFTIIDGTDLTTNIVVHRATAAIAGSVRDATGKALSGYSVRFNSIGTGSNSLTAYTQADGSYSVSVFSGSWQVAIGPYDLLARGYNPVDPLLITIPPTNAVADFTLIPFGPATATPAITTTNVPDAFLGQTYSKTLFVTNAAPSFDWTLSSGDLPAGLRLDPSLGTISGVPTAVGPVSFTVQLTDGQQHTATQSFTLNVRAAQPQAPTLDTPALAAAGLFTLHVNGLAGQLYTLQATINLAAWTDLRTTNAPANSFSFQDQSTTNTFRFYRVKLNPQ